ncbi:MAG: SH3 domain-containing protein, partial [Chloroflexota bacterium]|nr:SH3 domain-containing protein [Chloroflexota bacterium]
PELAADGGQEPTAAQPVAAPVAGDAFATADLNLRAGPSADAAILMVIPSGAPVATTGEAGSGYLGVVYNGQTGWADGAFIGSGAPVPDTTMATTADPASGFTGTEEITSAQPAAAAPEAPLVGDLAAAPAGAGAGVTVLANLRAGPSADDAILRVLPAGSQVTVTGEATNGYIPVWYNGTTGWLSTQAIDGGGQPATTAPPAAAPAPAPTSATGARTALEPVNLRAEAAIAAEVIGVIPGGVALTPLAGPESGFYQVSYDGVTGWVSGAYLREDGAAGAEPSGAYAPGPGLEPEAAAGGGLSWPVAGGNWTIMQGYNGSSHQDNSSTWQYYYSLDLVRANGDTAGQPVLAPAAGTVRWQDPSTGGISIDIGNGHAVAMFHVAVDPGLRDGTAVRPGQVIGHISGPGEAGFAGTPHLHFALWQTTDGGNWSRSSVPFAGAYAIAGQEFPDVGGANQHRGTVINV